jgi:hypothetical protein
MEIPELVVELKLLERRLTLYEEKNLQRLKQQAADG